MLTEIPVWLRLSSIERNKYIVSYLDSYAYGISDQGDAVLNPLKPYAPNVLGKQRVLSLGILRRNR